MHPDATTAGLPDVSECQQVRALCHLLLERIPDEGLTETLEFLVELWRFHRTPVPPSNPTPVERIPVKLARTYVRPVFPATED